MGHDIKMGDTGQAECRTCHRLWVHVYGQSSYDCPERGCVGQLLCSVPGCQPPVIDSMTFLGRVLGHVDQGNHPAAEREVLAFFNGNPEVTPENAPEIVAAIVRDALPAHVREGIAQLRAAERHRKRNI